MITRLMVVHGPNLNLLGEREPHLYGTLTLKNINQKLKMHAKKKNCELRIYQSNCEGFLIDFLHKNRKWADGVVINPGAYTHYSYALRDAVAGIAIPTIEVHLSDIKNREDFRKVSVIEPVCIQQISGDGWQSYTRAIDVLVLKKGLVNSRVKE